MKQQRRNDMALKVAVRRIVPNLILLVVYDGLGFGGLGFGV